MIDRVGARTVGARRARGRRAGTRSLLASTSLGVGLGASSSGTRHRRGLRRRARPRPGAGGRPVPGTAPTAARRWPVGGLALMVVPQFVEALELAGAVLERRSPSRSSRRCPVLAATGLRTSAARGEASFAIGGLLPLGAVQVATFGLVGRRRELDRDAPRARGPRARASRGLVGGLVLFAGIVTRPLGGVLARAPIVRAPDARRRQPGRGCRRTLCSPPAPPLWLAASRARRRARRRASRSRRSSPRRSGCGPMRPARRSRFVNGCAVLVILVGTPLAGLAFELPVTAGSRSPRSALLWAAARLRSRASPATQRRACTPCDALAIAG